MTLAATDTGFARAQRDYEAMSDDAPSVETYTCGYCLREFGADLDDDDPCCPHCDRHVCEWDKPSAETVREAAAMLGRNGGPTDEELARQWTPAAIYAALLTMNEDDGWRELAENVAVLLDCRRAELKRETEPTFDAATRALASSLMEAYATSPGSLTFTAAAAPPATLLGALARMDKFTDKAILATLRLAALSGTHPVLRRKLAEVGLLGGGEDGR